MTTAIVDWGRISYAEALLKQKSLVERRITDEIPDTLVFCEHEAVITLGRASQREREQIQHSAIEVLEVERGGHATYHGPGQVVAYPIFKVGKSQEQNPSPSRRGVLGLIRSLESWVAEYLNEFQLDAGIIEGKTGVWVHVSGSSKPRYNGLHRPAKKLSSIGIAARHWVSYHGIALNLSTGLAPWQLLNPCGLGSEVMSDVQTETGHLIAYREAVNRLAQLAQHHLI